MAKNNFVVEVTFKITLQAGKFFFFFQKRQIFVKPLKFESLIHKIRHFK